MGADLPPGSAGREPGAPDRVSDRVGVAETWDEGLAPQRTQMAWGRTGLAVAATPVAMRARAVRFQARKVRSLA